MDYDYEGDDFGGRVLWGRVIFFAVALLLMFFLGRCSRAGGVPQADLDEAEAEIVTLSSEKTQLEQQVAALSAGQTDGLPTTEGTAAPTDDATGDGETGDGETGDGATPDPTEGDTGGDNPGDNGATEVPPDGQTYVVEEGDTLFGLAEDFYGNARKYELIADANGLTRDNPLRIGQELVIPPDPDA